MTSDNLGGCFNSFVKLLGGHTKEGAIEYLKCLKEHNISIYWSDEWGKLIARPKSGRIGKNHMKDVMDILEISNKKDWERLKT